MDLSISYRFVAPRRASGLAAGFAGSAEMADPNPSAPVPAAASADHKASRREIGPKGPGGVLEGVFIMGAMENHAAHRGSGSMSLSGRAIRTECTTGPAKTQSVVAFSGTPKRLART